MNIKDNHQSMLNDKQQKVVDELEKNILLIASAGTGKTNTLAYRIVNIIEKGRARPEEICCLTFTNKACNEMKKRIVEVVGEAGSRVTIMTFHSFCYEIIRSEAKRSDIGLPNNSIIFDEEDCLEIIKSIPEFTGLTPSASYAGAVQKLINLFKEYRGEYNFFTADEAKDYQQVIHRLITERGQRVEDASRIGYGRPSGDLIMEFQSHGGELMTAYDNTLRQSHGLDFGDLINIAFFLLQDKERQGQWQKKYKYWCIDEVQDTSRLEYTVLESLFGDNNVIMCGDFFQTIYEWRGSQPDLIFDKFMKGYTPELVVYNQNYRSTQILLHSSYKYLKNRFPEMVGNFFAEDAMAMSTEQGEKISFKIFNSTYLEAHWIYMTLQRLKPEDLSRVCILTRSNTYNKLLSRAFQQIIDKRQHNQYAAGGSFTDFKLEFMLVDEFKFFRRKEIKDVLAVFNILANNWDDTSVCRIAKEYAKGIGAKTVDRLKSSEALHLGIRPCDILHPSTVKYDEPFEMLRRELENSNVVVFDVESTGLDTARDEIVQLAAIRIDRAGGIKDRMNLLLQATKSVGDSVNTHHITDERLAADGVAPQVGLQKFLDFARGSVIVGHNVGYDLSILDSQLARLDMDKLQYITYYDTLDIFRRFYPQLKNHKLSTIGEFCQVSHVSTHDAYDDICATGECLIYAMNNNIAQGIDERRRFFARYAKYFAPFAEIINEFRGLMTVKRPYELMVDIIKAEALGILEAYKREDETAQSRGSANSRVENLRSLYRIIREWDNISQSTLDGIKKLLNITSLSNTEFDMMLADHPKIPIITVHQAKGLEFDQVFFAGLQEGTFPSSFSLKNDNLDEEARLFYVGITRAKKELFLTSAINRDKNTIPCRFINCIPKENIDQQ